MKDRQVFACNLPRSLFHRDAMNSLPAEIYRYHSFFPRSFFSPRRNDTRMTKSAVSLRLPEGGIHPGEALCLISPGVPAKRDTRGEVVHS